MDFPRLSENLLRVRERISEAQHVSGLSHDVAVVAVTKGQPVSAICEAARVGLTDVGENRVQEALRKHEMAADEPVKWHLIGHLQTNKARLIPGAFDLVHSVDSLRVANALDRAMAAKTELPELDVLLQVNVAGEAQKSGCAPDEARELAFAIDELEGLRLRGLMTMAPLVDDLRVVRDTFAGARRLHADLSEKLDLPVLSMGMSGDYDIAVEEGATMVRLGTILFGERQND